MRYTIIILLGALVAWLIIAKINPNLTGYQDEDKIWQECEGNLND